MDCTESLELLSEFQINGLEETRHVLVATHLSICKPCMGVFQDIVVIKSTAVVLRTEEGITFPDEHDLWRRMNIATHPLH